MGLITDTHIKDHYKCHVEVSKCATYNQIKPTDFSIWMKIALGKQPNITFEKHKSQFQNTPFGTTMNSWRGEVMLVDLWLKVGTIQIKLKKLTNQFNLEIRFGFHFFIFSLISSVQFHRNRRWKTETNQTIKHNGFLTLSLFWVVSHLCSFCSQTTFLFPHSSLPFFILHSQLSPVSNSLLLHPLLAMQT